MATNKKWYILAYDIRDPKRLRLVARCLKGYGTRLQYSVFRCRLAVRELERLRWELANIMDKEDDFVVIPLCERCASTVVHAGRGPDWTADEPGYEII